MAVCLNEETLYSYLDDELSADAAVAAMTHLTGCARCADRAREIEQALLLIQGAFEEELPADVPTANLRNRVEMALSAAPVAKPSSWQSLLHSIVWPRAAAGPGLATAIVILAILFIAGWVLIRWQSVILEPSQIIVHKNGGTIPPKIQPAPQVLQADSPGHNRSKIKNRAGRQVRHNAPSSAHPESIPAPEMVPMSEPVPAMIAAKHGRQSRSASVWDLEANRYLEQTQLLLRSFRNTSVEEGDAAVDLAYEKQLSRELLSKNRLLRRSAERKEDSQTGAFLNDIEPLLLDIANLPEKPSPDDVRSIQELIREQKIIATLTIYSVKAER